MSEKEKMRQAAKWVIGVAAACIFMYLGIWHIKNVAAAVAWLVDLFKPLLIGIIFALILNVPMSFVETYLLKGCKKSVRRPLSILLSLVLILGLFIGIAVLVIPELVDAVKLITQIVTGGLDQMAKLDKNTDQMAIVGTYFSEMEVDWIGIKNSLEEWILQQKDSFMNYAVEAAGSAVGSIVTFFIALVFSIYILAQKEKLKAQTGRLIRVWLPERFGTYLIHAADVCSKTFKLFIAGQATEAVILGSLCVIGMLILRIPYAPMVGALIGVTALLPLVGAYVGTIVGAIMIFTVNPWKAFVFILFIIILQQIEGNAIYPRTVGARINLPAIWVLAAVTVGGNLAGPIGMLLGVPVASATFALVKEATDTMEQKKRNKKETGVLQQ